MGTMFENLSYDLKEQLLRLGKDEEKNDIISSKQGDDFIKELSIQFVEEDANYTEKILNKYPDFFSKLLNPATDMKATQYYESTIDKETQEIIDKAIKTRLTIKCMISENTLRSLHWSESMACFLYFTNNLLNPMFFGGVYGWLTKAYEKYPDSPLLKLLYGHVSRYHEVLERQTPIDSSFETSYKLDSVDLTSESKRQFGTFKNPNLDPTKLISEAIKADSKRLLYIQETYVHITEDNFAKHPLVAQAILEKFCKMVFPGSSHKSFIDIFISFLHRQLANYYVMAQLGDRAVKESDEALFIYKDNSYEQYEKTTNSGLFYVTTYI